MAPVNDGGRFLFAALASCGQFLNMTFSIKNDQADVGPADHRHKCNTLNISVGGFIGYSDRSPRRAPVRTQLTGQEQCEFRMQSSSSRSSAGGALPASLSQPLPHRRPNRIPLQPLDHIRVRVRLKARGRLQLQVLLLLQQCQEPALRCLPVVRPPRCSPHWTLCSRS